MNKSLIFALTLLCLGSARGNEFPLWEGSVESGGWRAFGNGMLATKVEAGEVKLVVDWMGTSFGVGAVFEKGLPDLTTMKRLVVEARASDANGTVLAPEWVAGEKAYRVAEDRQQTLTADWATYTFDLPGDFPKFEGSEASITALRLLFVNPDKPGRADVYFRNAKLEP